MTFMAWPEIQGLHNVRKFIRIDPNDWWMKKELFSGTSTVSYKCKIKLHGTNAAVQVHNDGTILCQSRESIITPEKDNAGFARWVMNNKEAWHEAMGYILYGEWAGPGIQKNVALADIPNKIFAVFAARSMDGSDTLIIEPDNLQELVEHIPGAYVLPWYDQPIDLNWKQSDEDLTKSIAPINDWVLAVEANDPWVEATFGVKGTGEGLVFYPVSTPHLGWENFQNLCFKAKGEKHKNIKTAAPVQVNAEAAASIEGFTELVLTPARLAQGADKVGGYDLKNTGKFVAWISADVEKEAQDELAASGLTWKQVQKPLTDRARAWYLVEAKK